MNELTKDAQILLDEWVAKNTSRWKTEGIDADEVKADMTAHLASDSGNKTKPVGTDEVLVAIGKFGGEEQARELDASAMMFDEPVEMIDSLDNTQKRGVRGFCSRFLSTVTTHCGWVVAWPILMVVFELLTGFCEGLFFSPVPSLLHVAVLLFACGGAWYHYRAINRVGKGNDEVSFLHGILRHASLVIALYWSLLMVIVLGIGTLGYGMIVVFTFGVGIFGVPLYVLGALAAGSSILLGAGLLRRRGVRFSSGPRWTGVLLGVVLLGVVEGPAYITRYGVANNSPKLIRDLGSEKLLLKMCYEGRGGRGMQTDTSGFLLSVLSGDFTLGHSAGAGDIEKRRSLYYQVTGRAFNSVEAPTTTLGGRAAREGVVFDEELGGDGVHARVADLDLTDSRLDGHVDAASGLGYWEWTAEFSNTGTIQKEARMQVLLPPGGVVSRLTLWVNGEPREAAFASKSKVTAAYKEIAVVQRRDPVLVRWVGPDRVFVQCFPVPEGGKMKIRLGITSELDAKGRMFLPKVIERNFGLGKGLQTSFWVQGDTDLTMKGLAAKGVSGKWRETHGSLPIAAMVNHSGDLSSCVKAESVKRAEQVWTEDRFSKDDATKVVVRRRIPMADVMVKPSDLVLVIDTSAGLQARREEILKTVNLLEKEGWKVYVVISKDGEVLDGGGAGFVKDLRYEGGQDNVAALVRAYAIASEKNAKHVLWLHGAQPVDLSPSGGLEQQLERQFQKPKLMTVDLVGGSNRVLEMLAKVTRIDRQTRLMDGDELAVVVRDLLEKHPVRYEWSYKPMGQQPSGAVKVWDQLARWKTWQDVRYAKRSDQVVQYASRYQLVTPVSGAVVLETKEQFDAFGLSPVDANSAPSIPSVPEPSTTILLMLAGAAGLLRRAR